MQKKEHKQLFQSLVNDKFDSFWSVNRKLMEKSPGETGFRNIPFRIHQVDHPYTQVPFQPTAVGSGQPNTLGDLIQHALPDIDLACGWRVIIHGIEIPLDSQVQWLSEHLSHADNFLHVCVLSAV
jgi:autophagy-related protein 5